jgi:hypothetical protein
MSDLPPTIYTLAEAAERLRMSRHGLAKVARRTGRCSQAGRALLFSEDDLAAIWQAMRVQPAEKGQEGPSLAAASIRLEEQARALLARPKRKRG